MEKFYTEKDEVLALQEFEQGTEVQSLAFPTITLTVVTTVAGFWSTASNNC